jgi:hypothetical protein
MHVVRNQVIHLIVGEIALFFSDINEFLNIVKSQAESLQRRPAGSKGCVVAANSRTGSQRVNTVMAEFLLQREAKRKDFRWADLVQGT